MTPNHEVGAIENSFRAVLVSLQREIEGATRGSLLLVSDVRERNRHDLALALITPSVRAGSVARQGETANNVVWRLPKDLGSNEQKVWSITRSHLYMACSRGKCDSRLDSARAFLVELYAARKERRSHLPRTIRLESGRRDASIGSCLVCLALRRRHDPFFTLFVPSPFTDRRKHEAGTTHVVLNLRKARPSLRCGRACRVMFAL